MLKKGGALSFSSPHAHLMHVLRPLALAVGTTLAVDLAPGFICLQAALGLSQEGLSRHPQCIYLQII